MLYRSALFRDVLIPWLLPMGLLALWQIAAQGGWISTRVLPSPYAVAKAGYELTASGELIHHLAISLLPWLKVDANVALGLQPLGSVDALTRIEMQQLMEELWQEKGFTGILVTHDVEEAAALADRVLVMENGRVAMTQDIDLPRPRGRGDARFGAVVQSILDRVMLSHRNASKEHPDGKPDNTPHTRSTEQALESARLCQSTGRA